MKKLLFSILIIIPFYHIHSQHIFSLEVGGGYTNNIFRTNELEYWDNGYVISLNTNYAISSNFIFTQTISYQNYFFNNSSYSLGLVLPAIYSFRIGESNGENSQLYEFSVGIRSLTPLYFFKTFASVRAGVYYVSQGLISTEVEFTDIGTGNSSIRNYTAGGDQFFRGLFSLGLGGIFSLANNLNLVLEGKLTTTVSDIIMNTSITSHIQYIF
jgi:hypothetical protein